MDTHRAEQFFGGREPGQQVDEILQPLACRVTESKRDGSDQLALAGSRRSQEHHMGARNQGDQGRADGFLALEQLGLEFRLDLMEGSKLAGYLGGDGLADGL